MRYKDTLYKHLIQSTHWQRVRNKYLQEHPCCEQCGKPGEEVHHIKNLMLFRNDPVKMEQMCFDEDNLMTVCRDCHIKLHREMGKYKNQKQHSKELHEERLRTFYKNYFE